MEAIGLALAVVPIFSICLQYFEYFKTAQTLSLDCQLLLIKLDFEHERLIIWGENHGLPLGTVSKRAEESGDIISPTIKLVKEALGHIETLFTDTRTLHDKYGVRAAANTTLEPEKPE